MMPRETTVLGLITARGGSKGIPRKNLQPLLGKPLIEYTIMASSQSKFLTRCIVSTDDEEIAAFARRAGADVPFLRPAQLAEDESSSIAVVNHALDWLKSNQNQEFAYVMILQPTSPLRTAEDIDHCIQKIIETKADSVMSLVALADFSVKKLKLIQDDRIKPYQGHEGKTSASRQDLETVYKRNCAIYLTKTTVLRAGDLFGKVSRPYLMPLSRSVDINAPIDFELAEFFMNRLSS